MGAAHFADVEASRSQEIDALDAWQVDLGHRQLRLRAALGEILLNPATNVGDVLMQADARASLLHDLDALAVADAKLEDAMVRTCFTHYSRALVARAERPTSWEGYCSWLAHKLHGSAK